MSNKIDSGIQWLGEIPSSWKLSTIANQFILF